MNIGNQKAIRPRSTAIRAGIVAAVSYATALMVNLIATDASSTERFWVLVAGGLIASVLLALIVAALDTASRADRARLEREYATHRGGYHTLNREISRYIGLVREFSPGDPELVKGVLELMFSEIGRAHV